MVQEVFHTRKQDDSKGIILELDFEKAFDTIQWEFLWQTLSSLGFGDKWIGWMRNLFQSIRVSILLNGSSTTEFPVPNDVRQGDPLSPLLFNLAVGVLSEMIGKASRLGILKGIQLSGVSEQITHL